MSKLNQGELLEILRDIKLFIKSERMGWWDEKDEQAYQQIKEMIKKPGVTDKILERARAKVKFGKEMLKTVANVNEWKTELRYDEAVLAILENQASKEVTEEWIRLQCVEMVSEIVERGAGNLGILQALELMLPVMLKEAGVEIKGEK